MTGHSHESTGGDCPACGEYIAPGRPVVEDYDRQATVCWACSGRTKCICCNSRNDVRDGFCAACRAAGVTVGVVWQHRWGTGDMRVRDGERTARSYWRDSSEGRQYDVSRAVVAGYIVSTPGGLLQRTLDDLDRGIPYERDLWITPVGGLTDEWLAMPFSERMEALRAAREAVTR